MRKFFLIAAVAGVALAGCSKDNGPKVPKTLEEGRIGFAIASSALTRGTDVTTDIISPATGNSTISVLMDTTDNSATPVIVEFTKVANSTSFNSATAYYWPTNDADVKFFAAYPKDAVADPTTVVSPRVGGAFAVNKDIPQQIDFVAAYATGNKSTNAKAAVPLHFAHQLAKVAVFAKSTNGDFSFEIKGVKIANIAMNATAFAYPKTTYTAGASTNYGSFTLAATKDTCVTVYPATKSVITLTGTAQNILGDDQYAYILPQDVKVWEHTPADSLNPGNKFVVLVNIKITDKVGNAIFPKKQGVTYANVAVGMSPVTNDPQTTGVAAFEAGKSYKINLEFGAGAGWGEPKKGCEKAGEQILSSPIFFTCDVEAWPDPIDLNLPLN